MGCIMSCSSPGSPLRTREPDATHTYRAHIMQTPTHTHTRTDTVNVHCHGGPQPLKMHDNAATVSQNGQRDQLPPPPPPPQEHQRKVNLKKKREREKNRKKEKSLGADRAMKVDPVPNAQPRTATAGWANGRALSLCYPSGGGS